MGGGRKFEMLQIGIQKYIGCLLTLSGKCEILVDQLITFKNRHVVESEHKIHAMSDLLRFAIREDIFEQSLFVSSEAVVRSIDFFSF